MYPIVVLLPFHMLINFLIHCDWSSSKSITLVPLSS
jgi:hypothetical protein